MVGKSPLFSKNVHKTVIYQCKPTFLLIKLILLSVTSRMCPHLDLADAENFMHLSLYLITTAILYVFSSCLGAFCCRKKGLDLQLWE